MIRVYVTIDHGDHAHYDWKFDTPTEHDEIVKTDKDIDIILDKREKFLEGVWIQYFHVPEPEFVISAFTTHITIINTKTHLLYRCVFSFVRHAEILLMRRRDKILLKQ